MNNLSLPKKVVAIAGATLLFAAISGTALAMIDPGLGSRASQPVKLQAESSSPADAAPAASSAASSEVEFTGTLDAMTATGWIIGGRTVQVTGATELKAGVGIGALVKVHARPQADGSLVAREIQLAAADNSNGNSNDNGNGNSNDNGNGNSNDDDDGNDNGNGNSNDNDDDDGNDNGNGNSNDNDDDDGNDNGNDNSNDNDDDDGNDNGNGNSNDNDDD